MKPIDRLLTEIGFCTMLILFVPITWLSYEWHKRDLFSKTLEALKKLMP